MTPDFDNDGAISVPAFSRAMNGIAHAFGTRAVSSLEHLEKSHRNMRVARINQIHGTGIVIVTKDNVDDITRSGIAPGGHDAIITDQKDVLIMVRTADCVPILIMDTVRHVIAAVHAGWRGTMAGIGSCVITTMRERFGCNPHHIRVAIGPSAHSCCYEVDAEVLTPLEAHFPYWRDVLSKSKEGRSHLDLRELNRRQLKEIGIKPTQIDTVDLCTVCRPELFYSYRRDGKATGHMLSGLMMAA